jgi:predicted Rossmann-fold nucleotide-binding protein
MDELWEALSWAQLGYHADPIGLLNVAGYYDKLVDFWEHMGRVGFVRPQHQDMLIVADTLDALLEKMAAHRPAVPIIHMRREEL